MSKYLILVGLIQIGMAWTSGPGYALEAGNATRTAIDRHALVIGVANYTHWPSVPHALDSAQKVARALELTGFNVTLLQDPSSAGLNEAFDNLIQQKGQVPERSIAIYYCGQAGSQTLSDGTRLGWLIPADCPALDHQSRQFTRNAISTRKLVDISQQIRSRYLIMLFDAAFAADLFDLQAPKLSSFSPTDLKPVRQFIVAGRAGEDKLGNGFFADQLVQALGGAADIYWDGYVTGTELAVFLTDRMTQSTKGDVQVQYGISHGKDSIQGEFFFHPAEPDKHGNLFIQCRPKNARIKILNIKPKFQQGMKLAPGSYWLQADAKGFVPQRRKIDIQPGEQTRLQFVLEKLKPITKNSLGMTFKWIGQGGFRMGSPDSELARNSDERHHWVAVPDGFWMQTTEVTIGQFRRFIAKTGYVTEAQKNGGCWIRQSAGRWQRRSEVSWQSAGPWMDAATDAKEDYPVTCITWNDAVAFARWLSEKEGKAYRLPTEQQWEMACRAGTTTAFAFGQCLNPTQANCALTPSGYGTCEPPPHRLIPKMSATGERTANPWGLADMHGNAAEWCLNRYGPYGRTGGERHLQDLPRNSERIIRGGHFASPADQCRSARRSSFKPDAAANVIGFRLAQLP